MRASIPDLTSILLWELKSIYLQAVEKCEKNRTNHRRGTKKVGKQWDVDLSAIRHFRGLRGFFATLSRK